jgi:hypothetical protein
MKIKNSLGKIQLKQLCEYYGLTVDLKTTKANLFQILSEFDEDKFLIQKGNKILIEDLSKINFQHVPPYCKDGKLYIGVVPKWTELILTQINLETFEKIIFKFYCKTQFNIFFHQNQMYGFSRSGEIFSVDLTNSTTIHFFNVDRILVGFNEYYEFVQYKNSKIYFSKFNILYCFDFETKKKTEILKFVTDTYVKFICVMDQGIILKSIGVLQFCDWNGNWTLIECLKHLFDANVYLQEETDLLYVSNGYLFHYESVVSNEILVFSTKDLENPLKRFWTNQKVICESMVVHGDYIYFLKVFEENKRRFGFSRTKLIENPTFSSLLKSPNFSDLTLIVNEKKFYAHKFILSAFTTLNLSKSELRIKMSDSTFTKAMEFMYDGIIPTLDTFEISELKTILHMKIQNSDQFFDNYKQILNSSDYSDFVIKFDNETEFKCHKIILSRESEYFKSLFLGNFDDSNNSEISIEEISPDHMALILEYFYCKSMATENVELMVDLIDSSKFLICNDLICYLNDKLIYSLNAQNVFAILKYATKEENEILQNKCYQLIKKNYSVEELMKLFLNYSSEMFSFSLKTESIKEMEESENFFEDDCETIEPPTKKQKK